MMVHDTASYSACLTALPFHAHDMCSDTNVPMGCRVGHIYSVRPGK